MSITTVTAAGDACLPTIGQLAEALRAAIVPGATVRLDMSQVAGPDLSVIQLIQSARATAARNGCDFALAAPAGPVLAALLARAGVPAAPQSDHVHFWFHGDTVQ